MVSVECSVPEAKDVIVVFMVGVVLIIVGAIVVLVLSVIVVLQQYKMTISIALLSFWYV
jgi:hypothetical protein